MCSGLARNTHAQEIWNWDLVVRGTAASDVWLAPNPPLSTPLVDPLYYPNDVVENPLTGELLIADSYHERVVRFDGSTGELKGQIGTGRGSYPYGLAVDARGNILVTDQGTGRVLAYDKFGVAIAMSWDFGANATPFFNQPWSISITPGAFLGDGVAAGEILIVDNGSFRVLVFGTDGVLKRAFGSFGSTSSGLPAHGQFDRPVDIAIRPVAGQLDPTTNAVFAYPYQVYVADFGNDRVQVLRPDGSWLSDIFGLSGVQGVAVDPNGRVLIADTYRNRIAIFSQYPGFAPVSAFIGSPSLGTTEDQIACDPGTVPSLEDPRVFGGNLSGSILDPGQCDPGVLQGPTNIGLDAAGHLLVIDNANSRFERFVQPAMTVTVTPQVSPIPAGSDIVLNVVAATGGNVSYANVSIVTVTPTCRDSANDVISCDPILTTGVATTITPSFVSVDPGAPMTFTVTYATLPSNADKGVTFVATISDGTAAHSATSLPSDPVAIGFTGVSLKTNVTVTGTAGLNGWWVTTPPAIVLSVAAGSPAATAIDWSWGGDAINQPAPTAINVCVPPSVCSPVVVSEQKQYLWFRARNSLQTETWQRVPINFEVAPALIGIDPAGTGWFKADVVTPYTIVPSISGTTTITPQPAVDVQGNTLFTVTAAGEGTNVVAPTLTVKDNAGLQATIANYGPFKIDKTPPAIAINAALDRGANAATGWYNMATGVPSVTFTASDNLSGFSAAQSSTGVAGALTGRLAMAVGEGANQGATVAPSSFTDLAGWNAVVPPSGAATLTCTSCTVPPGAAASRSGGGIAVTGLKVDVTLPTYSVGAPVNSVTGAVLGGQNGWVDLSTVPATVGATVNVTANDFIGTTAAAGSGIQSVCFNLTATGTACTAATLNAVTGSYPITVSTAGTTNGTIWAIDRAGNTTARAPFSVKINRFAPVFAAAVLSRTTAEDTVLTTTVTATDGDAGDVITYAFPAVTTKGGTLTNVNTATGAYTYTPPANVNGTDSFTISASDGKAASPTTATVTLTVTAVNDAPVAQDASVSTTEATAIVIPVRASYVTDIDTATGSVTLAIVSAPPTAAGTAVVNNANGTITFTPAANFNGTTSFAYRANDGAANSSTAIITVDVIGVNSPPVAVDGAATVNEDAALPITILGTLATDPDTPTSALTAFVTQAPANGTAAVNGTSVTYTPNPSFNGVDTFRFKANDGEFDSNIATVTITVTPVNDAPSFIRGANVVVNEDSGAQTITAWATALSAGPANESAQTLNFIVSNNNNALFSAQPTVSAAGALTFTPVANANGTATVSVQIHDNGGTSNGGADTSAVQTFTITVNPINDAPVAGSVSVLVTQNQTVNGQVLATDVDSTVLTYSILTAPTRGTVTVFNTGTGAFTYQASATDLTADSFTVRVSDGSLTTDVTVSVVVRASNQNPVCAAAASPASLWPPNHKFVTIAINNVTDPDGDAVTLRITKIWQDESTMADGSGDTPVDGQILSNGTVAQVRAERAGNGDGRVYQIDFTATDPKGGSCAGSVTVGVPHDQSGGPVVDSGVRYDSLVANGPIVAGTLPNHAPIAKLDTVSTLKGVSIAVAVLANDTDADGNALTVMAVTAPMHGTATINTNGTINYTPVAGYGGVDGFQYTISDGRGGAAAAVVAIAIGSHFDGDGCEHDQHRKGRHDDDGSDHDRDTRRR